MGLSVEAYGTKSHRAVSDQMESLLRFHPGETARHSKLERIRQRRKRSGVLKPVAQPGRPVCCSIEPEQSRGHESPVVQGRGTTAAQFVGIDVSKDAAGRNRGGRRGPQLLVLCGPAAPHHAGRLTCMRRPLCTPARLNLVASGFRIIPEHLYRIERIFGEILSKKRQLGQDVAGCCDDVTTSLLGLEDVQHLARARP